MTPSCFELFAGGGGWTARLGDLLQPLGGVEINPDIAAVWERNHPGAQCIVADVRNVDPAGLPAAKVLFMSPVCKSFSRAKTGGAELESDMDAARACVRFIDDWSPRGLEYVFLENVRGYLKSKSLRIITTALARNGYDVDARVLNAADYGVPQTRERLILRAARGRRPPPLVPTHQAPTGLDFHPSMFSAVARPWVGWLSLIEDIVHTLPSSQFADWQMARLPEDYEAGDFLAAPGEFDGSLLVASEVDPAFTVTANANQTQIRSFLIGSGNTQLTQIDSKPRYGNEPMFTVLANVAPSRTRAFIVDCQDAGSPGPDGQRGLTIRTGADPMFTVTASQTKRQVRAWLDRGRVVAMTPRALARFQSLPDTFRLPERAALACEIVGNAVPALLAREVVTQTMGGGL